MDNKSQDVVFQKYDSKYSVEVISLLKNLWRNRNSDERAKLFRWKYEQNPYVSNCAFVAIKGQRVVAFRGYTINPSVRHGKFLFYTACLADAVTDPSARGAGIFKRLTHFSLESLKNNNVNVILALSSNKLSTPGYLKLGWKKFLPNNVIFRVSGFNLLYSYIRDSKSASKRISLKSNDVHYCLSQNLDFELNQLQNLSKYFCDPSKISTQKDETWYKWRFSNPSKNYHFCSAWSGDSLVAFVLLNKSTKYWSVVDYCYSDDNVFETLFRKAISNYKPFILLQTCVSSNTKGLDVLKSIGFSPYNFILDKLDKKLEPILYKSFESMPVFDKDTGIEKDFSDASNWLINPIDSDAS